jgi:tetratricopeptide (TPR) repeat protein
MLRHWRIRPTWYVFLLTICMPILCACAQEPGNETQPITGAIAALDLSSGEASKLSVAIAGHDYITAEKLLLDQVNRDPHSARAARLLSFAGRVYFLNEDYFNAAIAWKKSEAIAELDSSARFSLAMAYIRLGRPEWARPLLQALATSNPKESLYPYWLGRLDYDAQQYNSAIAQFKQALAISPEMSRAYDNLGLCYFNQNNVELALASYRTALELDRTSLHPSPWPHLNLAIALQFLDRRDEAEAQLHEALRLDPKLAPAQYQLGIILEADSKLAAAVDALSEAAKLDTSYAEPHLVLARIYRKQGNKTAAQREVAIYLRLHAHKKAPPAG